MTVPAVDQPKKASKLPVRLTVAAMAILGPVMCYISRQNLSMAIIAMVDDNKPFSPTMPTINGTSPNSTHLRGDEQSGIGATKISYGPKYQWQESERNLVLGAFFWTYVACQIPGGRIAERTGAKWVLLTATLGSSILSAISPWAASIHVYAFVVVRLLLGVCQAALYPSCYSLLTHWLPVRERLQALPIMNVSSYLGSIIASYTTSYFSSNPNLGWEYSFYMPATLCGLWSIVWIVVGANKPREHKSVSVQEIDYIEANMGDSTCMKGNENLDWFKLFSSVQIWAVIVTFFSSNWSFSLILQLLPTYLNHILDVPQMENGSINAIIYILYCIAAPPVGYISAHMVANGLFGLRRIHVRKLFQSIGVLSQAVCFILLTLIGRDTQKAMIILYSQIILFSFVNGGEVHLPNEISVDFGSTIYAIGNCVGSSAGFLIPLLHTFIVTDSYDTFQWDIFFYVASSVSIVGGILFIVIGGVDPEDFTKSKCPPTENFKLVENGKKRYEAKVDLGNDRNNFPSKCYQSINCAVFDETK